ncbi:MAG: pyridoxamine 5'-phosphate oxidase [Planctomycetota bacterium]|jgi:pyridoxamine 5'-phosphate oxidase
MTGKVDLTEIRRSYESQSMASKDLADNPVDQFSRWLQQAREAEVLDATAMNLATVDTAGQPSSRIVLLKHFDEQGFCWYTDSRSRKGQDLAQNPRAALLFHWRDFSRQVRIQGKVEKLSAEEADQYFHSRPEGSRFSAASSHQSTEVASRGVLVQTVSALQAQYPAGDVPRPDAWIGYLLKPDYFEFWQGLENRLHDRIVYSPVESAWQKKRLSP